MCLYLTLFKLPYGLAWAWLKLGLGYALKGIWAFKVCSLACLEVRFNCYYLVACSVVQRVSKIDKERVV
jgi:hypothetical protein